MVAFLVLGILRLFFSLFEFLFHLFDVGVQFFELICAKSISILEIISDV